MNKFKKQLIAGVLFIFMSVVFVGQIEGIAVSSKIEEMNRNLFGNLQGIELRIKDLDTTESISKKLHEIEKDLEKLSIIYNRTYMYDSRFVVPRRFSIRVLCGKEPDLDYMDNNARKYVKRIDRLLTSVRWKRGIFRKKERERHKKEQQAMVAQEIAENPKPVRLGSVKSSENSHSSNTFSTTQIRKVVVRQAISLAINGNDKIKEKISEMKDVGDLLFLDLVLDEDIDVELNKKHLEILQEIFEKTRENKYEGTIEIKGVKIDLDFYKEDIVNAVKELAKFV